MKKFAAIILLSTTASVNAAGIPVEQAIELCRAEQNALKRLNCYDTINANIALPVAVKQAPATNSAATHTTQPAVTTETNAGSDFGIEHKKIAEEAPEKIQLTAKKISQNAHKELVIEFTNGQVWRQRGTDYYKIGEGEQHYIRRGALGSFLLGNDQNNRTIRVIREK